MRTLNIICLAASLVLFGCDQDNQKPKDQEAASATVQPVTATGTADGNDVDALGPVKVDVSGIHDDNDFRSAVDTAWYDYTTTMDSVPSAYTTARPKLQPFIDMLRAKDMKNYLAWTDAKTTNNYERQFDLEEKVPAIKDYKRAEAQIMKEEEATEAHAKKAKRAVALRKYVMTVAALYKGYVAKDGK